LKFLHGFIQHHVGALSVALVAAFAVAIYAYVLPLPFFRDDMVMLLWLRHMPWGKLWVDATGFPYYRPLSFSTLKLSELAFGWPEPISLHMLNLALHAANSVMVALLAERFFEGQGKRLAAICAGSLFAAYPFTYEVIPTTGPIFQLQAAFFGLASALAYAQFRSTLHAPHSTRKWLWLSLFLALMGTFTCEYGVIIPAFIVAVEAMLWWQSRALEAKPLGGHRQWPNPAKASTPETRFSPIPLAYFAFAAVYLAIWAVVPKSRVEPPLILQGVGPALRDMPVTALYYLQGLTYPLQPLAWPLIRMTGMSQELGVLVIGILTLVGIIAVFARAKRLPLLAFGLAWFVIALAPMWPSLNADYTLNGPRLHYLPSLGTTMIWGSLVAILWQGVHRASSMTKASAKSGHAASVTHTWKVVGGLVLVLTLVQSLMFLYGMADLITIGGRLTADVSRAIAATPPDAPSLVVNFPSWIGKRTTTFALGAEGLSFLPGYSYMRDLVLLNTQADRNVTELTFPNTIKEWKYDQRLGSLVSWNKLAQAMRAARQVWSVEYLPNTLRLSEAGSIQSIQLDTPRPAATFYDRVGVRVMNTSVTADELRVELGWTTTITVDRQLAAFVHVYDPQGKLVAQQDGYPLLGLYPPWIQQRSEVVRDVRRIPLPAHLAVGHFTVGIGMYDLETGQRVEARSPSGGRFENDVYLFYGFDVPISDLQPPSPR
jgi:hypothetical protein